MCLHSEGCHWCLLSSEPGKTVERFYNTECSNILQNAKDGKQNITSYHVTTDVIQQTWISSNGVSFSLSMAIARCVFSVYSLLTNKLQFSCRKTNSIMVNIHRFTHQSDSGQTALIHGELADIYRLIYTSHITWTLIIPIIIWTNNNVRFIHHFSNTEMAQFM